MRRELHSIYDSLYHHFGPQHWWPADSPFEVAVGAILTQNTNWTNVEKAIHKLKQADILDPEALHRVHTKKLASLIRPAGYFNIKAKRLKHFMRFFMKTYCGEISRMKKETVTAIRKKLLSVHGIGPETADSIILYALEKPVFVIDAYTKRVLARHTILDYNEPYETYQELFHSSLKKNVRLFNEYHALFVRLAKEYCRTQPHCGNCPLEGI
jgi:endonuclease-3 related protein